MGPGWALVEWRAGQGLVGAWLSGELGRGRPVELEGYIGGALGTVESWVGMETLSFLLLAEVSVNWLN